MDNNKLEKRIMNAQRPWRRRRWWWWWWAFILAVIIVVTQSVGNAENNNHHQHHRPRPPRIKEHPSSTVVKKHDPVTLACKADGDPEPVIKWYRDNELVPNSPNHIYLASGDLFILKVMNHKKERDTGVYYCLAQNLHGKARSQNATIEIASIRDEFRKLPKNVYAAVGETTVLECSPPRGYPEPRVQWRKNGEVVPMGDRYRMIGTNLHISDLQPENAGQYQCVASNMAGSRESPIAHLYIRVKPYFIRKPEDVTALSNNMSEIHCKVGGDPPPKVTWRREGGQIPAHRFTITEDNSLQIYNVTEEDEGVYVCEAENLVDKISHSASLNVYSKPTFLIEPKDVRVNVGGSAKFDCKASGNPRPSVFWTKEGQQFLMFPDNKYEDNFQKDRFTVTSDGSLIISPVKKEDMGYYVCSALSVVGSATSKAFLNVTSTADSPPPIIVLGPANQTLPEHTTATLPCEVYGIPMPQIRWLRNNSPVQLGRRFNLLDTGALQIDDLQSSDSGEYKCVAYSETGETSWSAFLEVASPHSPNTFYRMPDPATFPDPPSRPNIVNVTENSITISWQRTGSDGASPYKGAIIEYFSPDHHTNEWIRVAQGVTGDKFTVTGLRPGSRYFFIVRAQNGHGIGRPSQISHEARTLGQASPSHHHHMAARMLDLAEVRHRLENVVVELRDVRAISSSDVKLYWSVHGASHEYIEGFYIRYRVIDPTQSHYGSQTDNEKDNIITVYNGATTSYVVNNVPKFSTLEFFIVPFYKSLNGRPSNTRVVRTPEDVPSAAPTSIKARPINSNSALIIWQPPPPDQINGILLGYILFVHGTYTNYNLNLTVDANTTSYLLRNLTTETEYVIQVTAFTNMGPGTPSAPLTFIMDPLLSSDVYNERNVATVFDSSNVWICVLIISLIILSLIVLLLGFLLFKKRSALLKKNGENSLPLNRELKSQADAFYHRHFEKPGWQTDSRPQSAQLKHTTSGQMLKISPTMAPTENNGYSTVTTDDQAADYADYDYVSQGENNYESTYDPYVPVAYASSSIVNSNPYRSNAAGAGASLQPTQQHPWRTQFAVKNDNPLKSHYTATLDRSGLPTNNGSYGLDSRFKKNMYETNNGANTGNKTSGMPNVIEPLIGSHFNDYEDANHYHYADSAAYCGAGLTGAGNVTQIPSSKLMANQVKYGSLSRINSQQSQFHHGHHGDVGPTKMNSKTNNFLHDNFRKKPGEWKTMFAAADQHSPVPRNNSGLTNPRNQQQQQQLDFDSKQLINNGNKTRHLIANPLANESTNVGFESSMSMLNRIRNSPDGKTILDVCDSESTYQELS